MTTATSNGYTQIERFKWAPITAAPGDFQWIDKHKLHVDHTYQRHNVSASRVAKIARDWSWARCLALGVSERTDGLFFVFDGQHRKLAADKREDVVSLPCLVFPFEGIESEASGFVGVNTVRGPVRAIEIFRGRLVAGDPDALFVADLVQSHGYVISGDSASNGRVRCVALLTSLAQRNSQLTREIFALTVRLHDGASIHDRVLGGLFELECNLGRRDETILRGYLLEKLMRYRVSDVLESIRKALAYHNKGGHKVYAQGIIDLINKGSSTRRIPPLFG